EKLFGQAGGNLPIAFPGHLAQAQGEFPLLTKRLEKLFAELRLIGLGKFNAAVRNRVMSDAVVGSSVVVKQTIDVVQTPAVPLPFGLADQPLNMALAENTCIFCDGLWRSAKSAIVNLGQPLDEKAPVDEERYPPGPHCLPPSTGKRAIKKPQGFGTRSG
ncbi:MAG: hypothetical protein LAT81_16900, partial [Oceanicaulis sp.]|nr:hypothetical protein [Oceanicaulis sp.]